MMDIDSIELLYKEHGYGYGCQMIQNSIVRMRYSLDRQQKHLRCKENEEYLWYINQRLDKLPDEFRFNCKILSEIIDFQSEEQHKDMKYYLKLYDELYWFYQHICAVIRTTELYIENINIKKMYSKNIDEKDNEKTSGTVNETLPSESKSGTS